MPAQFTSTTQRDYDRMDIWWLHSLFSKMTSYIGDVSSWADMVNGRTRRMGEKASGRRSCIHVHVNVAEYWSWQLVSRLGHCLSIDNLMMSMNIKMWVIAHNVSPSCTQRSCPRPRTYRPQCYHWQSFIIVQHLSWFRMTTRNSIWVMGEWPHKTGGRIVIQAGITPLG